MTYADCDVEEPNGHLFLPPSPEERVDVPVMIPIVDEARCNGCGECADVCEFNAIAVMGTHFMLFPSLCHACGACVALCPENALCDSSRPIGFIRSGESGPVAFVGGSIAVGESQSPPMIRAIKRRLPSEGLVIIDAPPGTSCPVVEAVRNADYVILVTEPTPFGLHDLRLAVGMLRELNRDFGVVMNRCDIGDSLARDYCASEGISIVLELPFDRALAETYSVGKLAAERDDHYRDRMMTLYQNVIRELTDARACGSQR